jgi:hypothetical protein
MSPSETPLEMVSRHVSEGEAYIAQQVLLVERLRRSDTSAKERQDLLSEAEALLVEFRATQSAHITHLRQIRSEQEAGLRDADGNLKLA